MEALYLIPFGLLLLFLIFCGDPSCEEELEKLRKYRQNLRDLYNIKKDVLSVKEKESIEIWISDKIGEDKDLSSSALRSRQNAILTWISYLQAIAWNL